VIASSDGYCSFIAVDESIMGRPLSADSELVPEQFRDHYKNLSEVCLHKLIDLAMQNRSTGFAKV
jgi:hypothetical protein